MVQCSNVPTGSDLKNMFEGDLLKVSFSRGTLEHFLLKCADLSGKVFSMRLSLVERLSPKVSRCQVVRISDAEDLYQGVKERIAARRYEG